MMKNIKILLFSILSFTGIQIFYTDVFPPLELLPTLETGDIILRTSVSLDSMVLSRVSLGPYSHIGLVYRDSNHELFVLESFPDIGLRKYKIYNFLAPRQDRIFRIKILQFKEKNRDLLKKSIEAMVQYSHHIHFDMKFIYDKSIPSIEDLKRNEYNYYCVEMVNMAFQMAYGPNFLNWPNDYDKISLHLTEQIGFYKQNANVYFEDAKFRMVSFLNSFFNLKNKVVLSPNGILNSPYFITLYEDEDLSIVPQNLKVFLT